MTSDPEPTATAEPLAPDPDAAPLGDARPGNLPPTTGFRLYLPPVAGSLAAARTALRRVIRFTDEDSQSRFLTAFTEVVINAIEEHQRMGVDRAVVVTADLSTTPRVSVSNATEPGYGARALIEADHTDEMTSDRGRGLLMARALVPRATFDMTDRDVTVTLPLEPFGRPA